MTALSGILFDGMRAAIGPEAALFTLAAMGLNINYGYTGLLNVGQVGFMLVGAYGVAVTVAIFGGTLWLGVVVSILLAGVVAFIIGLATLRLRAIYLAIATLSVSEMLRFFTRSGTAEPFTGGAYGLSRFAGEFYAMNPIAPGTYGFSGLAYSHRSLWVMIVSWGLVALFCGLFWLGMHSPWGRMLRAIREDENAARSLGKNVFVYKMQSLIIGGVLGALAGVVLAINQQAVTPDIFLPQLTFFAYAILIIGGAGRVFGPVVGGMIFWFIVSSLDSALRVGSTAGILPAQYFSGQTLGAIRFALVGLALMLLMVYRPQGVLGDRNELAVELR